MKVLIVEDDQFHAQFLQDTIAEALPEVTEIVHARDGQDGEAEARQGGVGAIVMDLQMPRRNGIEAARAIWQTAPETRILFWSNYSDEAYLRGISSIVPDDCAYGYVLKTASPARLRLALRAVFLEGQIVVDREIHHLQRRAKSPDQMLDETEYAVLIDLALGLPDKMIATRRHVSLRTVQNRLISLYEKLGVGEDEGGAAFNKRVRALNRAIVTRALNAETLEAAQRELNAWLKSTGQRSA